MNYILQGILWWAAILLMLGLGLPWLLKFLVWYYPWVIG